MTSVDSSGQESGPSSPLDSGGIAYPGSGVQSATVTWTAATGAISYNIYRTSARKSAALPAGAQYGFVGNVTSTTFIDTQLDPDFSQGVPIPQNPFQGSGVQSLTLTANGSGYTSVPTVALTPAPGGGVNAVAYATLEIATVSIVASSGWSVGDSVIFPNGVILNVTAVGNGGSITSYTISNRGTIISGSVPTTLSRLQMAMALSHNEG